MSVGVRLLRNAMRWDLDVIEAQAYAARIAKAEGLRGLARERGGQGGHQGESYETTDYFGSSANPGARPINHSKLRSRLSTRYNFVPIILI
jgi:hypothetical protein